ncbi:hypothetical protein QL374_003055 [Salmonella enterica]|nr:hypothetical protein [Salmonella enterica]EKS3673112.1 hypothetical protein [Salmonella enterica]ELW6562744.1 hypothetical protein [Salmonella enterica]ELZ1403648.1 hypothetical protein [Salmonella enterica]
MKAQFFYDSTFPNGAYSHSFGLESYISWSRVNDAETYQIWLETFMMENFAPNEGAVYEMVSMLKNKKISILKLSRFANASITNHEGRQAAVNIARATLSNTEFMHNEMARWYSKVCENELYAYPAVASALVAGNLGGDFAYATIKTLTQNATRAIPLSYKKSCKILFDNIALAERVVMRSKLIASSLLKNNFFSLTTLDKYVEKSFLNTSIFSTHHELDISMLAHEKLDFRLFMS